MDIELRDIHLPEIITWWPPAPYFWIILFLLSLLIVCSILAIKYYVKPTVKKQAIRILLKIEKNYEENLDGKKALKDLSALLRRVAITEDPLHAGLTGKEWLKHLDKGIKEPEFSKGIGQVLLEGPYSSQCNESALPNLFNLIKRYLEAK